MTVFPKRSNDALTEIEAAPDAFEKRPARYDPADIARSGVFVSIDGGLKIERGFVRHEDEAPVEDDGEEIRDANAFLRDKVEIHCVGRNGETRQIDSVAALASNGVPAQVPEEEEDGIKPLSERLVMELTAHRTLSLRDALANDPDTAFLAILHALALQTFWYYPTASCFEIKAETVGNAGRMCDRPLTGLQDAVCAVCREGPRLSERRARSKRDWGREPIG